MVKIDIPMPKTCKDCPIQYDKYWCPLPHENPGMRDTCEHIALALRIALALHIDLEKENKDGKN